MSFRVPVLAGVMPSRESSRLYCGRALMPAESGCPGSSRTKLRFKD